MQNFHPEAPRCRWCNPKNPIYIAYHDTEWGHLTRDERYLYEIFFLEGFQAGLSWECVLSKRSSFRLAFDNFDPERIANYTDEKIDALLQNPAIIRSRSKIKAAIENARIYRTIVKEYGCFFDYLTSFFKDFPIIETDKTASKVSDAIAKDCKRRGMKYMGSITVYAFLQAVGLIVSHEKTCFLYQTPERMLL